MHCQPHALVFPHLLEQWCRDEPHHVPIHPSASTHTYSPLNTKRTANRMHSFSLTCLSSGAGMNLIMCPSGCLCSSDTRPTTVAAEPEGKGQREKQAGRCAMMD